MKVLGLDPGLATLGWGVLEEGAAAPRALRYGAITTPARRPMAERLQTLARDLRALLREWTPAVVAVEELYFAKDSRTAASVGHARGVILLVLAEAGLPIHEYNPRQVKMALTGYGAADKSQMQTMIQRLLKLTEIPTPDDAADALAIGLCHMNTFRAPATRS